MTTKTQEREALNKIRDILGTLDADGWVNTAFKGVCDIAQENIDNDFACSPVERVEELEKKLEEAETALDEVEEERDDTQCNLADLTRDLEHLRKRYDDVGKRDDKRCEVLDALRTKYKKALEDANVKVLEYCGDPESAEFKSAVASRQDAKRWVDKINEVL